MAKGQKSGTPLVKLLYASRGNFLERCFIRYKGFLNYRYIKIMQLSFTKTDRSYAKLPEDIRKADIKIANI